MKPTSEAREQLMNENNTSSSQEVEQPKSKRDRQRASSVGGARPKEQKQKKQQQRRQLREAVALDMARSNGAAGDNNNPSLPPPASYKKKTDDIEKMTSASSEAIGSPQSCSIWTKCLLIILMGIFLTLVAFIIAILAFDLLDIEDSCLKTNSPFQQTGYKFFTTKTTYNTAFDQLNRSLRSGASSNVDYVPKIFSTKFSLKSINDHLTSQRCEVRQLHYYGRHAARFPDEDDIKKLNQVISKVQNRIDLSKFIPPPQNNAISSTTNELGDQVTVQDSNVTPEPPARQNSSACENPMTQYKQWTSLMSPEQDNLITESGFNETMALAKRLKEIFPLMFNSSHSSVNISTTKEIRTAQTVVPFIEQLDNYKFSDRCSSPASFPTVGLSDRSKVSEIKSDVCLNDILKVARNTKLEFHKACASVAETELNKIGPDVDLERPDALKSIASSVSQKLKLDHGLDVDEVRDIYSVCKYESAFVGSSIWCNLFSDDHLKFFEYLDDVEDFFKSAYGDQYKSSCPVTVDLVDALKRADDAYKTQTPVSIMTRLHFTHSQAIRKILAATVNLEYDKAYKVSTIESHVKAGSVPPKRDWRSSLFTPFSANLLFALYECKPQPPSSGTMNIVLDNFRVVASLNEQPIFMHGCDDEICDYGTFKSSRIAYIKARDCDLENICAKKYKLKGSKRSEE